MTLEQQLGEGNWKNVANPSGGFMGFWWHRKGDKYLQLENEKLCFKIKVPEESQQSAKWTEWHQALMAKNGQNGLTLKKPVRRSGTWMTVAVLDEDYRKSGEQGRLDFQRTVDTLKQAEALMDSAL